MKLLIIAVLFVAILASNGKYPASEFKNPLFPKAKSMKLGDQTAFVDMNSFKFTTSSKSADLKAAMDRYMEQIFVHRSSKQSTFNSNDALVNVIDITVKNENVPLQYGIDESYNLFLFSNGTTSQIKAETVYGAYHALESFAQLLQYDYVTEKYTLYNCPILIDDKPFHRGLLIDSARHFLSLDVIKKVIRSLTYAKMNVLHWHIVDNQSNPTQSKKFPTFWASAFSKSERYTQVEMAEVVEYARQRGIRVMIEFDVPGHQMSWCKGLPQLCPSDTCLEPLDLTNDFTYEFLDEFFAEMTGRKIGGGIFPETFFHLGGDEVDLSCWDKVQRISDWLKKRGMTSHDGYLEIVNKTQHIVMDQGRDPVQWEEIWLNFGTKLDKRQIIHIWLNRNTYIQVINNGYRSILSNANAWYLTTLETPWTAVYDNSLTDGIKEENYKYIMGGEVCMWGEFGKNCFISLVDVSDLFQTVWPRAAAAAERMWSNPEKREADTEDRMKWFRCYMTQQGIDAAPVMNKVARQNPPNQNSCYIQ